MLEDLNILADSMELENAVQIDIDELDEIASKDAGKIVQGVTELYYDKDWMSKHPQVRHRIEIELETLRGLIKMRKADEKAHDALLNGISSNNTNASLYRALGEIQRTSLAVTKQINETVQALNNLIKGYQLELQFTKDDPDEQPQDENTIYRGSKSFIADQIKKSDE